MKKKEIIGKLIEFVNEVAEVQSEYEHKPIYEYFDEVDTLAMKAQDLLEEIENA